jgi:hypothetical protein
MSSTSQSGDARVAEVVLFEPIERIKGIDLAKANTKDDHVYVSHPLKVTVDLPSGKSFQTTSYLTILRIRDGKLRSVSLKPLSTPTEFVHCLNTVEETCRSLGVLNDSIVKARLETWKKNVPSDSVALGATVVDPAEVYIEIRPAEKRWFVVVDFN